LQQNTMKANPGFVIALAAALACAARSDSADAPKAEAPDYYPFTSGAMWHYQVDLSRGQKIQLMTRIASIDTIGGQRVAHVETVAQGVVKGTEHIGSNAGGVFRYRQNGAELSAPVCLLKYPPKEGETWEAAATIDDQPVTMSGRAGRPEEIQVPAGKYATVSAQIVMTTLGVKVVTTDWFAANVGVVKRTIEAGGRTITMELLKYEAGR
jgi:hypothetical protein